MDFATGCFWQQGGRFCSKMNKNKKKKIKIILHFTNFQRIVKTPSRKRRGLLAHFWQGWRQWDKAGKFYRGDSPNEPQRRRSALHPGEILQGREPLRTPILGSSVPGDCAGARAPTNPNAGAPPCTRVTFSPMRKSPKNLPEGVPSGYSPFRGTLSLPLRHSRNPLEVVST